LLAVYAINCGILNTSITNIDKILNRSDFKEGKNKAQIIKIKLFLEVFF